mmetsp:Transcript_5826/g.16337  ORF Transcript_5826/g.16337 Transcript_5826/m.16337 type:complete len:106 (-) Transcript_5826:91-408(-)
MVQQHLNHSRNGRGFKSVDSVWILGVRIGWGDRIPSSGCGRYQVPFRAHHQLALVLVRTLTRNANNVDGGDWQHRPPDVALPRLILNSQFSTFTHILLYSRTFLA